MHGLSVGVKPVAEQKPLFAKGAAKLRIFSLPYRHCIIWWREAPTECAPLATIESLQDDYLGLERRLEARKESEIEPDCLLVFDYEYSGQEAEVTIDTQEFTSMCPWSGLPDFGTLAVCYVPDRSCIELKSLKYYLLSYREVGIVQEHAANRILNDLVNACNPIRMTVTLDYNIRGGIHSCVTARQSKA